MTKYNLICASHNLISCVGMGFFAGFAAGAAFLPNLSDKYGRKWYYIGSLVLQFVSVLVCCVLPGDYRACVYVIIFMFFLHGVAHSITTVAGFSMMCDVCNENIIGLVGSLFNCMDGSTYIFLTVYFRYISKNWLYPQIVGLVLTVIPAVAVSLLIPESPKWLFRKGKFKEAHKVLDSMAKFNGKELVTGHSLLKLNFESLRETEAKQI